MASSFTYDTATLVLLQLAGHCPAELSIEKAL